MRRIVSWLLLGAVVALGAAAGVDALRGGGEPRQAAERAPTLREPPTAAAENPVTPIERAADELRAAGVSGVLTYADERCRVRSVSLPELEFHPGAEALACRFRSTVGNEFSLGGSPPAPFGGLTSRCRRGAIELLMPNGDLYARSRGCGLAWKPDGTPTFLRRGEVMRFARCASDEPGVLPILCSRTLLSRADLVREFRLARWLEFQFGVEELQWLDDRRFAAIVRARSAGRGVDLLAVFEGRRLLSGPLFGYEDLEGLRPSPTGALVTARILDPGGLAVVDRRGRVERLAVPSGDAVTWSPDERWVAEAVEDEGIVFFRADERNPRLIFLPIVARDLVWR
jgi:hypothetical protein